MPWIYGVSPAGHISRVEQSDYELPEMLKGFVRVEGRRDDMGVRKRPPKRIYEYDGNLYTSVRAVSRAIGCSEEGFKRAVRNGRRKIIYKSFEVWEQDEQNTN